jgi:hypothetical protein
LEIAGFCPGNGNDSRQAGGRFAEDGCRQSIGVDSLDAPAPDRHIIATDRKLG